jgi:tetratricopeptide (TPR) repeat protein
MKKNAYILLCLIMFVTVPAVSSQENQINTNDQVKTIDPVDMVRPTADERAMRLYNLGTEFMRRNNLTEAEKLLIEAITLDPEFVDAIDHLGVVYRRLNRLDDAEKMYLRSIELNKENVVPYINLAVIYRLQGKLNDAFHLYMRAAQIRPDYPEGYYGAGEMFYIVGDYENAMIFFDKAIELYNEVNSPTVYDAYYYKGMIYYHIEKYNEALHYLEEARKVNPNNEMLKNTINEIKDRLLRINT